MKPTPRFFAVALAAAVALQALLVAAHSPAQAATSGVAAIDTDCLAIQDALPALHPIHVALENNKWTILSDADFAVAQGTTTAITLADVYQQGKSFAWVVAHRYDANGNQRAVQLCYRQSDGSLQRAKQAATLPNLDAADVSVAYFAPDGTVLSKVGVVEVNDPMVAKQVSKLPFFSLLP
jgi:hypothetical protein